MMSDINYVRERILESCRLLFDQEVQIITLARYYNSTPPFKNLYGDYYTAIIIPKGSSLKSVAINGILFESEKPSSSRDLAILDLLGMIEKKMGGIFVHTLNPYGPIHRMDPDAIEPVRPIRVSDHHKEPVESSAATSSTQTTEDEEGENNKATGATILCIDDKEFEEKAMLDTENKAVESTILGIEDKKIEESTILGTEDKNGEEPTILVVEGKKVEEPIVPKGKIWRVVGYTASGELCIKEHEPESQNSGGSFARPLPSQTHTTINCTNNYSSEYPDYDSIVDFTPGTSVVSDSGTVTPSLGDEHSPVDCAKKFEEANREIARLGGKLLKKLEEADKEIVRLGGKLLKADREIDILESRLESANKDIEKLRNDLFEAEIKEAQSTITIKGMGNEIESLKESIRVTQESQVTEQRLREEELGQALANLTRTLGLRNS